MARDRPGVLQTTSMRRGGARWLVWIQLILLLRVFPIPVPRRAAAAFRCASHACACTSAGVCRTRCCCVPNLPPDICDGALRAGRVAKPVRFTVALDQRAKPALLVARGCGEEAPEATTLRASERLELPTSRVTPRPFSSSRRVRASDSPASPIHPVRSIEKVPWRA